MTTAILNKRANPIITATLITLFAYCGLADNFAQADESRAHNPELRQAILEFAIEGLTLSSTPRQAHETLVSAGFKAHRGNKPGNGIYWKKEAKTVTRRILLKSINGKLAQIQYSFAEKGDNTAWKQLFSNIKSQLGSTTGLCRQATERDLYCKLFSQSPTILSADITTRHGDGSSKIRIKLDQQVPGSAQNSAAQYAIQPKHPATAALPGDKISAIDQIKKSRLSKFSWEGLTLGMPLKAVHNALLAAGYQPAPGLLKARPYNGMARGLYNREGLLVMAYLKDNILIRYEYTTDMVKTKITQHPERFKWRKRVNAELKKVGGNSACQIGIIGKETQHGNSKSPTLSSGFPTGACTINDKENGVTLEIDFSMAMVSIRIGI